jgi:hypothetical protein
MIPIDISELTTRFDNSPLFLGDDDWLSNKKLDWFPMDTQKLFEDNVKKFPTNKSLIHYSENKILYDLNRFGFRTDANFDEHESGNIFLGCSHTFGIGHHLENTWSYKVNKEIGGSFFNLGSPGLGIQNSVRLLQYWSNKLNIKNIFHYQPIYHRYEFYKDGQTIHNSIHHIVPNDFEKINPSEIKTCLMSNHNIIQMYRVNILAIESIAKSLGINYYVHLANASKFKISNIDLEARDLAHHTVNQQSHIADLFLEKII